jgi:hypothetical protein
MFPTTGRASPRHTLRRRLKTGTHRIRLKSVNWLLDVIAPDAKAMGQVIANAICVSIRRRRGWWMMKCGGR